MGKHDNHSIVNELAPKENNKLVMLVSREGLYCSAVEGVAQSGLFLMLELEEVGKG